MKAYTQFQNYSCCFYVFNYMENYNIYRNMKFNLLKNKLKLAELKVKSAEIKAEIETLEIEIEENINGLNMVFDSIIGQRSN